MNKINKKDEEEAKDFLMSNNLIEIIANESEEIGIVNERMPSQLLYLIASSRKQSNPMAGIIKSDSSSGKSVLVNTVKKLIPKEEVKDYTRITPQYLFYAGKADPYLIQNKFLIIGEDTGAREAYYALRSLLSEKEISLGTIINKEATEIRLIGPVSFIDTSTSDIIDDETANRLLDIGLNESIEQNIAVQEDKKKRAVSGWNENEEESIIRRHHTAQRMLQKVNVVIPYAPEIKFPFNQIRTRRDIQRFLDLISTITYLHQFQRKVISKNGFDFVEANLSDYEIAHGLIESIIKRSLDELNPKARDLYQLIKQKVNDRAKKNKRDLYDINFTRNDIVKDSEWTLRQVRNYVEDLIQCEFINVVSGTKGKEYVYQLNQSNISENSKLEITTPEELREKWKK